MRTGKVIFFDRSGEGMVYEEVTGKMFYVHYSAIDSKDSFKTLKEKARVEFKLYRNLYMEQIDYIREIA